MTFAPGVIRDSILDYLATTRQEASTGEIATAVQKAVGEVPASSIRSYLNINTPNLFERTSRGRYRLRIYSPQYEHPQPLAIERVDRATIFQADCFDWLSNRPDKSIHAFVTDPPYGLIEYSDKEKEKLRNKTGGVWRVPPSFDGHERSPLPRFTILSDNDRKDLHLFFKRLGMLMLRTGVPGANIIVASNPLLSHIVGTAMVEAGLELRGYLARQVMTMRGGDRPKNAHEEFSDVSVMPRSQWEPWVILRTPLEGRVQDNLRKWGTGGFRRISADQPFGDVIKSHPTPAAEKRVANHPSLKPQAFMRQVVRASLPLGQGLVCDPFMGGGSTIAAANAVGYGSLGIERDEKYFELAKKSIEKLTAIKISDSISK